MSTSVASTTYLHRRQRLRCRAPSPFQAMPSRNTPISTVRAKNEMDQSPNIPMTIPPEAGAIRRFRELRCGIALESGVQGLGGADTNKGFGRDARSWRERSVKHGQPDVSMQLLREAASDRIGAVDEAPVLRQGAAGALRLLCRTSYSYICGTRACFGERSEFYFRERPSTGFAAFRVSSGARDAIMTTCSGLNDSKDFGSDSTFTRSG